MVFRFLVFLLLAYFFFRVLRVLIRTKRDQDARSNIRGKEAQEMVLDPQCQSYLPRAESLFRAGHYFCSEQCARLYLAR